MQRRAIEILDPNITVAKKKASKILHKSIFTIHKYYRGELMLSLHDYLVILCYLGALQETVKD